MLLYRHSVEISTRKATLKLNYLLLDSIFNTFRSKTLMREFLSVKLEFVLLVAFVCALHDTFPAISSSAKSLLNWLSKICSKLLIRNRTQSFNKFQ